MKTMELRFSWIVMLIALLSFGACKGKNKDADIQTAIQSKTTSDANFAGVNATVAEGVVTLTGSCADAACKTNAEAAVKDIDGVKKVVNNITVAPVTIQQDDPLNAAAQRVVAKYGGVTADVSSGVITLRGQMLRDSLQQLMMELNELHPQKVENQLVLK